MVALPSTIRFGDLTLQVDPQYSGKTGLIGYEDQILFVRQGVVLAAWDTEGAQEMKRQLEWLLQDKGIKIGVNDEDHIQNPH